MGIRIVLAGPIPVGQRCDFGTNWNIVYFCPLVDKLTGRGCHVLVLEQAPEHLTVRTDVLVTHDSWDLRRCQRVLCTAATLINGAIESVLTAVSS